MSIADWFACLCHSTETFPTTPFRQASTQRQLAWHLLVSISTKSVWDSRRVDLSRHLVLAARP